MTWREIIKAKGKLSTIPKMKVNSKPIPTSNKKDCNKKLKEYANDLDMNDGFLMFLGSSDELGHKTSGKDGKYSESICSRYNPVPEKVACKLLDMIGDNSYENRGPIHRSIKLDEETWTCFVVIDTEWEVLNNLTDAGIMAGCYIDKKHLNMDDYPILLRHHVLLERKFEGNLKEEILQAIDWR